MPVTRSADILQGNILIVDDKEANVLLLDQLLRSAGYARIGSTTDPQAVCALHRANHYDLILLDLQMPGLDGFAVMEGLKAIEPDGYIPVLAITAQPGHKRRALEAGAKDLVSKPFDLAEVLLRGHNLLEVRVLYRQIEDDNAVLEQTVQKRTGDLLGANEQLLREIAVRAEAEQSLLRAYGEIEQLKNRFQAEGLYLQQDIDREFNFGEIIGQSAALERVFVKVEQVAPLDTTVLLLGETGTGKGAVARAIHNRSARRDRPLVTVDCTALPANLIESELFGRGKGAYTGSGARPRGLRQRKEDIPLLVNFFVAKFNKKIGRQFETVEKETLKTLQDYHWPGNVRELESVIERAVITSQGTALRVLDRFETSRPAGEEAGHEEHTA